MVAAGPLVNVDATTRAWTRARDLLDGFERLLLVLAAASDIGLVSVAGLFFVERHLADNAVACFAQ